MANLNRLLTVLLIILAAGSMHPARAQNDQTQSFKDWLAAVEQEAIADGVSPDVARAALAEVAMDDRVVDRDQRQPESTLSFDAYAGRTASERTILEGRDLMKKHAVLLKKIGAQYGVAPQIIVALWGMESRYGRNKGDFPVVDALATLAFEGRRADFFRQQLIAALHILDQENMESGELRGSWAGALGQCQFIPTTYLRHAVDYDKDGRRDIWNSLPDVFASIANYIVAEGWDKNLTWGRPVELTREVAADEIGLGVRHSLAEWSRLGLVNEDGTPLPKRHLEASLVQPDGSDGRSFLVYDNFRALMRWNRSSFFAASVGLIADQIK